MPARGRKPQSSTHVYSVLAGPRGGSPATLEKRGMLASGSLETYFPPRKWDLGWIAPGEDVFAIAEHLARGRNAFSTAARGANQTCVSCVPPISQNYYICASGKSWFVDSPDWLPGFYGIVRKNGGAALIDRIRKLREQEYDDEPAPSEPVVDQICTALRDVENLMHGSMPEGTVSTFYGEVNATWRRDNDIVRLTCFPNRPSILQFGNLSQPLGSYQSIQNPTAENVADHLSALMHPSH